MIKDLTIPLGLFQGKIDLFRLVIRRDLLGGEVKKMKRLDQWVPPCFLIYLVQTHAVYYSAATVGSFASVGFIFRFGNNYSIMFSPLFISAAGGLWLCIKSNVAQGEVYVVEDGGTYVKVSPFTAIAKQKSSIAGARFLLRSIYWGARKVFARRYIWFLAVNSIALYSQRYIHTLRSLTADL
jgi:hypothetical protein